MHSMHTQPSAAFTLFSLAQLPAVPWKNGGGTTREIACWPAGADMNTFDWRISVARIDRDGPFSAFDGIDRIITLLDGAGVRLRGVDHILSQPLSPFAFDGAAAVQGELIDGPCEDLNIMSRRPHIDAQVRALHATTHLPGAHAGMLLAIHSAWQISRADGPPVRLAPGEGIWWHDSFGACTVMPETTSPAGLMAVAFRDSRKAGLPGGQA